MVPGVLRGPRCSSTQWSSPFRVTRIAALGGQRSLSPEVIEQIKAGYHLDKPFIVQYLLYLKGLFTLDLGQSLRGTESVLDVLCGPTRSPSSSPSWHWPSRPSRASASASSPG